MTSQRIIKLIVITWMLGLSASLPFSFARAITHPQDGLPESTGVELVRTQCLNCHESDLIVQQRLSKAAWTREVEKMIRWGAITKDADKEPLAQYLTRYFGQRPLSKQAVQPVALPSEASVENGKAIFENKCLTCHEIDLTQQQRLSRTGWTREVEKMVRWGATVMEAEKEPLTDYLFKNFGPRPRK